MNTDHGRRINRRTAEDLLDGGFAPDRDPLTRLLAAAAAPGRESERGGEDRAVTAFEAHHLVPVTHPGRGQVIKSRLARFLTTKVLAVTMAVCATGGVALAASMGAFSHAGPVSGSGGRQAGVSVSGREHGTPGASVPVRHASGGMAGAGQMCQVLALRAASLTPGAQGAPGQALTQAQLEQALASPAVARVLRNPQFAPLIAAVRGASNVGDYCALRFGLPKLPVPDRLAQLPPSVLSPALAALPAGTLSQVLPSLNASPLGQMLTSLSPGALGWVLTTLNPSALNQVLTVLTPSALGQVLTSLSPGPLSQVLTTLSPGALGQVLTMLSPGALGQVLTMLSPGTLGQVLTMLSPGTLGQVLTMLSPSTLGQVLTTLSPSTLGQVLTTLSPGALANVLTTLHTGPLGQVLTTLRPAALRHVLHAVPASVARHTLHRLPASVLSRLPSSVLSSLPASVLSGLPSPVLSGLLG